MRLRPATPTRRSRTTGGRRGDADRARPALVAAAELAGGAGPRRGRSRSTRRRSSSCPRTTPSSGRRSSGSARWPRLPSFHVADVERDRRRRPPAPDGSKLGLGRDGGKSAGVTSPATSKTPSTCAARASRRARGSRRDPAPRRGRRSGHARRPRRRRGCGSRRRCGNSSSMIRRERRPTSGISSSPTSNWRLITYWASKAPPREAPSVRGRRRPRNGSG